MIVDSNKLEELRLMEPDKIIVFAIRTFLSKYPKVKPSDTLVNSLYHILTAIYVKKVKHIILRAPTGSGKTIISFGLHYCTTLINVVYGINVVLPLDTDDDVTDDDLSDTTNVLDTNNDLFHRPNNSYILTSSKLLQSQIEKDLPYFKMSEDIKMLKGVRNYMCDYQRFKLIKAKVTDGEDVWDYDESISKSDLPTYGERYCTGMTKLEQEKLPCYGTCQYLNARNLASCANSTVLNYAYYLTVINSSSFIKHFENRYLTIADEAHLLPNIIVNQYNIVLTAWNLNKFKSLHQKIAFNFPKFDVDKQFINKLQSLYAIFYINRPSLQMIELFLREVCMDIPDSNDLSMITMFKNAWSTLLDNATNAEQATIKSLFEIQVKELIESVTTSYNQYYDTFANLKNRLPDFLCLSENIGEQQSAGGDKIIAYKHSIYDLSEQVMCRKYFIDKINAVNGVAIYMSATIHVDNFAKLMGLTDSEYVGFSLESDFNFDKSPIYYVNSGYLNYSSFQNNINDVLFDVIKIVEKLHPGDKGIIHTATFGISELLYNLIAHNRGLVKNTNRYLFYRTPEEKENCINKLMTSVFPYVIIGPSLYEGLDLKDDYGRFNIAVKVPWASLNDYVKQKMERVPFWYENDTIEKVEQMIGRTNRHVDDWSITYLMDSGFSKIIPKLNSTIGQRVNYKFRLD